MVENKYKPAHMSKSWLNINPFMLSGIFYLNTLDQSISNLRGIWSFFIITMFYRNSCINANMVDPNQMLHSVSTLFVIVPFMGL